VLAQMEAIEVPVCPSGLSLFLIEHGWCWGEAQLHIAVEWLAGQGIIDSASLDDIYSEDLDGMGDWSHEVRFSYLRVSRAHGHTLPDTKILAHTLRQPQETTWPAPLRARGRRSAEAMLLIGWGGRCNAPRPNAGSRCEGREACQGAPVACGTVAG
jgi:hypothetical protein